MEKFNYISLLRHRFNIDGKGICTLVALYPCHLSCEYCLNKKPLKDSTVKEVTTKDLVDYLMIDYCYFLYSGGGITFGGGEPLLQSDALLEFRNLSKIQKNTPTSKRSVGRR